MHPIDRPRRLRATSSLRRLVKETRFGTESLVYPIFIREGTGIRQEIPSLPGQFQYSPDTVLEGVDAATQYGVFTFLLFGIPAHKDPEGSSAWDPNGAVQSAIKIIKKRFPYVVIITDVCMCEYTSHGHCGVLRVDKQVLRVDDHEEEYENVGVDNDATLPLIAKTALSHAQAGADLVAPSDMMDGRVAAIRRILDLHHFENTPIMSYAVKYASAFYGPFREAAGSAPGKGDRKGYQMDPHNRREARREAALDRQEGADILIVKPALSYLDVVSDIARQSDVPVAAYSVSGEYAMIKAAAQAGFIDEQRTVRETAVSVYRAGADILISYYAPEIAEAIQKGELG